MKRIIYFAGIFLLLIGCSSNNEETITGEAAQPPVKQEETFEFPFTNEEAIAMADHLINEMNNSVHNIFEYEGEEPTEEVQLERLNKTKHYATDSFFEKYLAPEITLCFEEHCPYRELPTWMFLGLRNEIKPISATHYQSSAVFPYDSEHGTSFRQTLDIKFVEGTWKIDEFTNQDEDLNLQAHELEDFLQKLVLSPTNIQRTGTRMIDGRNEEIYQFTDSDTGRTFEVFIRTGQIEYIAGDLDFEEDYSDQDFAIENEDDLFLTLLFEDQTIYRDQIDSTSIEVQRFLEQDEALNDHWAPPYFEDQRSLVLWLHDSYNELLGEVFNYYMQFYPYEEGVSELDQFFKSWNYVRTNYYEQFGIHPFDLRDEDIQHLTNDIYMIRQQIHKVMLNFSAE